jgi:hypothetical protein
MHNRIERSVLNHDIRSNGEREITAKQAEDLVASGLYRLSSGAPHGAVHYRRGLSDGSCLHLVVETQRRRLHHDAFNPHAGLLSLGMHVAHEARSEALSLVAVGWIALRLLAR